MKQFIFKTAIIGLISVFGAGSLHAQHDTVKTKRVVISYGEGITIKTKKDSTVARTAGNARFIGGITFTRLDIGFTKLVDNGSFTLTPANDFLDYNPWKTSTVSFDVLQIGYRFNRHFKAYVAGGFDWTLIRLDRNITVQKNTPDLTFVTEPIDFKKNRFSNSYVHFPLNFELRTKEDDKGRRIRLVFGPEVAFLLNGKVKQISKENGKVKITDDYQFRQFRYGGTVRLGYGGLGVFAKYYANDMFETDAQKGLKNMSFGITFGLN